MTQPTPKDRYDACMTQANYSIQRYTSRRDLDWKIDFGIWALLLALGNLALNSRPAAVGASGAWAVAALYLAAPAILLVLYTCFHIRIVWLHNEYDQERANHFLRQAQDILANPLHVFERYNKTPQDFIESSTKRIFGFLKDPIRFARLAGVACGVVALTIHGIVVLCERS